MKNKKRPVTRREFLKWFSMSTGATISMDPLANIINAVSSRYISQAYAETITKSDLLRYVLIQNTGGPPRHFFDLFLSPNSGESIINHPITSNAYTLNGGRYTGGKYQLINRAGFRVPSLWGLKTSAGGQNISDLLNNMLVIQGIRGLNASHAFNYAMQSQPVPGGESIGGRVSDHSAFPLSAVSIGNSLTAFTYKSKTGKTLLQSGRTGANQAHDLFKPFKSNITASMATKISNSEAQVADAIKVLTGINSKYGKVIVDHEGAKLLMHTAIGHYIEEWQPLYLKYKNLLTQAIKIDNNLVGIADKPIGSAVSGRNKNYSVVNGKIANIEDLRDAIVSGTTSVQFLAENFATTEFLILNNYTHSIRMGTAYSLIGAKFNGNTNIVNDQHFVGYMPGILSNTLHYRAYAACLLELISQLKSKIDPETGQSIFTDTLIHLSGEFNRLPAPLSSASKGYGTGHGFLGISSSFFSGRFNGLQVIGDTLKSDKVGTSNRATWGLGAPQADLNGRYLGNGHLANSVAFMLNIPPLVTNADSLLRNDGGEYKSMVSRARLVDNT